MSTAHVPAELTHEYAQLNPFRPRGDEGGEEQGTPLLDTSIAGGGRRFGPRHQQDLSAQHDLDSSAPLPKQSLPVSFPLRQYLHKELGLLSKADLGPAEDLAAPSPKLSELLARPEVDLTGLGVLDPNHPLPSYFVSSSHNTYLVGQQLVGKSSSDAYRRVIRAGACCVEIDAWDDEKDHNEPKVTHGMTLVSHVAYRSVLQVIRTELDAVASQLPPGGFQPPLLVSLECHCSPQGQRRLVGIAKEELGPRLACLPQDDPSKNTLADLAGRVVFLVEWYGQDEIPEEEAEPEDEENTTESKPPPKPKYKIIPELQELGLYANSIKPKGDAWLRGGLTEPANHLINIGEGPIASLIQKSEPGLVEHSKYKLLPTLFPRRTRET